MCYYITTIVVLLTGVRAAEGRPNSGSDTKRLAHFPCAGLPPSVAQKKPGKPTIKTGVGSAYVTYFRIFPNQKTRNAHANYDFFRWDFHSFWVIFFGCTAAPFNPPPGLPPPWIFHSSTP